ncbi:anti-sigma factor family protein [Limobrevibacterium gyesilva]|uniref:Zf-HC2 domain-containing protein n=1 Tax=Limobrevibacterium gyesilva TaxID=2991712 RepID=A0AA41YQA9_9PROT|nr:zf-HC2 domain-containing protein [Limobrevibacterium gyesilva]MCW3474505.1 zf-HC2 domain-containing protein [Limobrevibacterium gyesilva]
MTDATASFPPAGVPPACEEMQLLIQADLDGELDAAATAVLAAHLRDCAGCAALQRELANLSGRLHAELRPEAAPASLRRALEARLAPAAAAPPAPGGFRRRLAPLLSFGAGAAIAASLALMLPRTGADPDGELVAGHIRALQPGHLTDVASSDQHTVKPWFDGRIDYAPPVMDFVAQGFPLVGGRLDYIGGRPVAALVYRRDKHPIDLFVWPSQGSAEPVMDTRNGYNVLRWARDGMAFRAVSDLNAKELADFARLWQGAS